MADKKESFPIEDESTRIELAAQQALENRPSFSIRYKLMIGFFLLFLLSAIVTLSSLFLLNSLETKLQWLVSADRYLGEIQQARRFEKNYFLYGSNLQLVTEHVERAQLILDTSKNELASVLGRANFATMRQHLDQYALLIEKLILLEKQGSETGGERAAIEQELRDHGQLMVSFAMELADKEHKNVEVMFKFAKRVPIIFLVVLLVLIVYLSNFLTRQFLRPLNRLMGLTERIAEGDFTPILPARKYKDEFSNLTMALNHMMHELNRRQELMIQSHKLRAIGTLTAGIAHELNNPINNITLTVAMLKEDYASLSEEERQEMIDDLEEQAERAGSIVKNLLDFARESETRFEPLSLRSIMEDSLKFTENEIKMNKIRLEVECQEEPPKIFGDRQKLSQVFINLILNAVEAMEGKGGTLRIQVSRAKTPGFVEARFEDTGPGIPPHVLKSIFDPFFTTKSEGKGHGLGLSVSLGIVKKHGGDILVESEVGKGSVFRVILPVAEIPADMKEWKPVRERVGEREDES